MPSLENHSPIAAELAEFMDFFKNELEGITFPDVDAEKLDALAATVRDRAKELRELNDQVQRAQEALQQAQAELRHHSERGLAYVRVYAEGNPELSGTVAELGLIRDTQDGKNRPQAQAADGFQSQETGEQERGADR